MRLHSGQTDREEECMRRMFSAKLKKHEDYKIQKAKDRAAKEQRLTRAVASTIPDKPVFVPRPKLDNQ